MAVRSKQEAGRMLPKTKIPHILSLILTCQLSEQCPCSSADPRHIVDYIKHVFHGSSHLLSLYYLSSFLGYRVLKCQGFLLIALSGHEKHMHTYTQTLLGKALE